MSDPVGVVMALIPLPLYYNSDEAGHRKPIEDERFTQSRDEVATMFGGAVLWVFRNEKPRGAWWNVGILYQDELAALEVDIPNTPDSRQKLRTYASEVLLDRFEQEAIYVKLVPVETMLITRDEVRRR